ncbi:MAG TPA: transketolase C-terminal domain-containing protein [Anaerovoracaceae bacterium]|nr:transketolase C-terminal domain-containing protein [Anaerovoracaceae bacterium]
MNHNNQRIAFGETLVELGAKNPNIVVLEADLGKSTMSSMFQEAFPDRYFEMGIAEANMTSVAAGLALSGKIAFTNSFAVFAAGRAYDQIRQTIAIGKLNVKICGSSSGCSDFGDGATHQAIEDIAIMSALPNMTVLSPVDANETVKAVRAMAALDGPCYLRVSRTLYDSITAEDAPFEIGLPSVLKEGSDIALFATGHMCVKALEAARQLEGRISVKVINVSTIKPLNEPVIAGLAGSCKAIVTAEEHSVIGGLGSAVAHAVRYLGKPLEYVGVNDEFGCSAHSHEEIMGHLGLTVESIKAAVENMHQLAK